MIVGVLNLGSNGNIYNIVKALEELNYKTKLVSDNLSKIDKLIIPGVGSFKAGIDDIEEHKQSILEFSKKKPILGICLGMQLLCNKGFEFCESDGLSLFDGEAVKLNTNKELPHIGWNNVEQVKNSLLLNEINNRSFYFMHSYSVINYFHSVGLTKYGNHQFVSVIEKDNIFGVQFHPEKSRSQGLQILDNFIKAKV